MNTHYTLRLLAGILIHLGSIASSIAQPEPLNRQSLLWRITTQSGLQSHIFGTIHLADTAVFRQRDTVLTLIDRSQTYASELNLDSMFQQMKPEILMISNGTLYDVYDSSDVQLICATLDAINPMLARACSRMKPGAIMLIASMAAFERTAPTSIDEFLWARARKAKLQRYGLERFSEQVAIIDSMPASFVISQIRRIDSSKAESYALRDHYVREELDSLHTSEAAEELTPEVMAMLNDRRNLRMVERMMPLLDSGGAFVAIGAMHLSGPGSVLEVLRQKGYSVEPVLGGRRINWLDQGATGKRR